MAGITQVAAREYDQRGGCNCCDTVTGATQGFAALISHDMQVHGIQTNKQTNKNHTVHTVHGSTQCKTGSDERVHAWTSVYITYH